MVARLPLGSRVEGFVLRRIAGEGARAIVYEAVHPMLGNQLAVKIPHSAGPAEAQAEGRALAAASGPHVPRVWSMGSLSDSRAYLMTEWIDGPTLGSVISAAAPPLATLLEVAVQLLRGLEAVHRAGLVHRDVKPSNVQLASDGAGGRIVKLLDFGITVPEGTEDGNGVVLGTPRYMAPERFRGAAAEARADVYAVGAVLFELSTGRPPFVSRHVAELADESLRLPLLPPSVLQPDLPRELDDVVLWALCKDPSDRPASAREMRRAISAFRSRLGLPGGPGVVRLPVAVQNDTAAPARTTSRLGIEHP